MYIYCKRVRTLAITMDNNIGKVHLHNTLHIETRSVICNTPEVYYSKTMNSIHHCNFT